MKNNLIEVYENALSDEICDKMIECFTNHPDSLHKGVTRSGYSKEIKSSVDLNLVKIQNDTNVTTKIIPTLYDSLAKYFYEYNKKYPLWLHGDSNSRNAPEAKVKTELFRKYNLDSSTILLKKYTKKIDGFHAWHEDQGGSGLELARILVCMYYLNDVEEGGETEFYYQDLKVKPTKGSLVIFPSYFTHLHKGHIPISNDKYICNFWVIKQ